MRHIALKKRILSNNETFNGIRDEQVCAVSTTSATNTAHLSQVRHGRLPAAHQHRGHHSPPLGNKVQNGRVQIIC